MHPLVIKALSAVRKQDWPRASKLLEAAEAEDLDKESLSELLGVRAAARRRQGLLNLAREDYTKLAKLVGEEDPRFIEAYEGLAECFLAAGAVSLAQQLIEKAIGLSSGYGSLEVRCRTIRARCLARNDLMAAKEALEELFQSPLPGGSARANARFYYGDVLLAIGDVEDARQQYGIAHAEAEVFGAPKTAADCLRREATTRLALNERSGISEALEMIRYAEDLYQEINDRSLCLVYAERGEIFKHTGMYRKAHVELRRATLSAREGHESLRVAHGLLGQADLFRTTKTWKRCMSVLEAATTRYEKQKHPWGQVMCAAVDALLQRQVENTVAFENSVEKAMKIIEDYPNAVGSQTKELIASLDTIPLNEPLLLIYPD